MPCPIQVKKKKKISKLDINLSRSEMLSFLVHKLEVLVANLSPKSICGRRLTCGSWKAEVVHLHNFYFSSGVADYTIQLFFKSLSKVNWQ